VFLFPGPSLAQDDLTDRPQILALFDANSTLPANVHILEGLLAGFDAAYPDYDFYAEYRDVHRFAGQEADARFLDQIVSRYAGKPIDAVLLFGPWMLEFGLAHRDAFAPGVPVLFGGVSMSSRVLDDLPEELGGAVSDFDLEGTLDLARQLQPDARGVVVFTGTSAFDRSWEARARDAFADLPDLAVEYVTDLSLDGFKQQAASLDPDTILILLTVFQDATGESYLPRVAAGEIAAVSSAPAYSVYDTFIGSGVVGGRVETFESLGHQVAQLAVTSTEEGLSEPAVVQIEPRVIVDWPQLARFGLDMGLLPDDAIILNYQPTAWERYRLAILGVAFVLALQTATIALLLVQGRLRRTAEEEAQARQLELTHASRVGHLGELSGAFAHELSQPLTAILANAQAGAQLASKSPPDLEEIRAILSDIIEDDQRAAALIADLRQLMTKQATEMGRVDLNAVVRNTLDLARSELLAREIRVSEALASGQVDVQGNAAQLQQIVLNLVLNAADAMAETSPAQRRIVIRSRRLENGWRELSVQDAGVGLNGAEFDPFRAFATTKANGLGLGLSISRTIAEAHGGQIDFDRTVTEGARVVLALPPP
jgi:signal transduction histidine kinase